MQYFIDVILPIPLEKLFTYHITKAEASFIQPGMRVAVPFGKSKIYTAIVYNIHNKEPQVYEAKDIHQILDDQPIVTLKQLELWQWISKYYLCTLGEAMRAALPSAFLLESETIITRNAEVKIDETQLKDDEFLIYEALHHHASISIQDVSAFLNKKNVINALKILLDKNAISVKEEIYEKYKPKLVRHVRLNEQYNSDDALQNLLNDLKRAPKQKEIILSYYSIYSMSEKPVKVADLIKKST